MPPSTRTINYAVRANKHIERRMLMEVLQRLDRLPPRLSSYRYVGFGGIYFTDFVHAHQHLGIADMVSIEHNEPKERFEFNKPLACIKIRYGTASDVLPGVLAELRGADAPGIYWLDYDGAMDRAVADDIGQLAGAATPWTFLAVTVNSEPGPQDGRLEQFRRRFEDTAPPDITNAAQLAKWRLADVNHRMLADAVETALVARNAALPLAERLHYRQLIRFHYADGAKMLTTGGIFHTVDQADAITEAMDKLPQLRARDERALLVQAPVLTAREVRNLSAQLPGPDGHIPTSPGVHTSDAERFADLYRHYPLYAQVEIL